MSSLKVLREVHDYTQEYVAEQIGVDQSTYSKLERNPKNLKADQAEKLAKLYDVSLADILSQGVTVSFSNNNIDKGYVHNLYEEQKGIIEKVVAAKDGEIQSLKAEIEHLRKQNDQLMKLLEKK